MDFDKYSEWNPFVLKIKGKQEKGAKLDIHAVSYTHLDVYKRQALMILAYLIMIIKLQIFLNWLKI